MAELDAVLPEGEPPMLAAPAAAPAIAGAHHGNVKLSPFWPQAPVAWFAQAECIFPTKHVTDSFDKYCHLMASLSPESVRLVMDVVEVPATVNLYEIMKERLLSHLQLSTYERLDQLFTMPGLGSRKPSAMLAAMVELCPRGEENMRTFAGLFLHCLPRELRILLAHEDLRDLKQLAARADVLHTHHKGGAVNVVNVEVYAEDNAEIYAEIYSEVNSVSAGSSRQGHSRGCGRTKGGGRGQRVDRKSSRERRQFAESSAS
jgi:hypothetical protein